MVTVSPLTAVEILDAPAIFNVSLTLKVEPVESSPTKVMFSADVAIEIALFIDCNVTKS